MSTRLFLGVVTLILITTAVVFASEKKQAVTIESLVEAMIDRDRMARFPSEKPYKLLQASSYDREAQRPRGSKNWFANNDGFGHIRKENNSDGIETVLMEHDGPGAIVKMWAPFFFSFRDFLDFKKGDLKNRKDPKIRIYLDGSRKPIIEEHFIELLTRNDFPNHWQQLAVPKQNRFEIPSPFSDFTARAGNLYLPIPFAKSCKITLLNDSNFYNIINYMAFPSETRVETFTTERYQAAQALLQRAGNELKDPTPCVQGSRHILHKTIPPDAIASLSLPTGSHAIRHFEIKLRPDSNTQRLRNTIMAITFDEQQTVWSPVGDFFCSGPAIKPYQTWEREVKSDGTMVCRWVMPYRNTAKVLIQNRGKNLVKVDLNIRVGSWNWDEDSMYFHAKWRYEGLHSATNFRDWNFIDIKGKGVHVGDQWTVLTADKLWWGEGDEKIYVDDEYDVDQFPSHFGTGTEDYYGWAGGEWPQQYDEFSAPFLANVSVGEEKSPRGYNICTRSRALDAIPFHTRFVFDMEALPLFAMDRKNDWELMHYSAMVYYYALPGTMDNRTPQPNEAALPVITVKQLEHEQTKLRNITVN